MILFISILDKMMLGALFVLIIFIPYSIAMIQIGISVIMAAWLLKNFLIFINKSITPKPALFLPLGLEKPLLLIGILILATAAFSYDPQLTLKKFFSRFLQQIFLVYVTADIIRSPRRLYLSLIMLLWTLLVVNADVFVQFLRGQSFVFGTEKIIGRATGPMRHPNDLGTLLATVLPIVLALVLTWRFWVVRFFGKSLTAFIYVVMILLFFSSMVSLGLTFSRGAWAAFILSMLGFLFFIKDIKLKLLLITVLSGFIIVFGVNWINVRKDIVAGPPVKQKTVESVKVAPSVPSASVEVPVEKRISSPKTEPMPPILNASSRDIYWRTAYKVIERHPIFGCGYNAYIQALQKLKIWPQEYPHNGLLRITAELGLIGLCLYLWFFILVIQKGWQVVKLVAKQEHLYVLASGLFLAICGWLLNSLIDTPWESFQLSILWWMLLGILLSFSRIHQAPHKEEGTCRCH